MKKSTKYITYILSAFITSGPALLTVMAASKDFKYIIENVIIGGMLRPVVSLLVALAVVVFIYGVLVTMLSEGGAKREEGKQYMIWGIIGISVMVSVWGLVAILRQTFNLDEGSASMIKLAS